jgi:hypothetical protein
MMPPLTTITSAFITPPAPISGMPGSRRLHHKKTPSTAYVATWTAR